MIFFSMWPKSKFHFLAVFTFHDQGNLRAENEVWNQKSEGWVLFAWGFFPPTV